MERGDKMSGWYALYAEIEAVNLLIKAGEVPDAYTTKLLNYQKLADRIILLAEKIKAERLSAGVNY